MAGPRKFLVVDEALTVTRRTRRYLQQAGVAPERILSAFSGEAALELFEEHQPEVVLLALDLNDADGHDVAQAIWERDPRTRVVLVTVAPQQDPEVRETIEDGAHAVLEKPVREADVRELLAVLGEESRGRTRIPPSG